MGSARVAPYAIPGPSVSAPPNVIVATAATTLASAGFKRRSRTWYRAAPVGLLVVNVQKSNWGQQFYVNFGVYVRALGDEAFPPIHHCHFYARAASLDREQQPHWEAVMDLEKPMDDALRREEFTNLLTARVLPFLDRLTTTEGLRAAAAAGEFEGGLFLRALREYLDDA